MAGAVWWLADRGGSGGSSSERPARPSKTRPLRLTSSGSNSPDSPMRSRAPSPPPPQHAAITPTRPPLQPMTVLEQEREYYFPADTEAQMSVTSGDDTKVARTTITIPTTARMLVRK